MEYQALEAADMCPGGIDQKIKNCGCRALLPDINKVARAMEGDQTVAACELSKQLVAKHGQRACLLHYKTLAELTLNKPEDAQATLQQWLQAAPKSAQAHSVKAILDVATGDLDAAINAIQDVMELVDNRIPYDVLGAAVAIGQLALQLGEIQAAEAHLMLDATLDPKQDSTSIKLLTQLQQSSQIPLLIKDGPSLRQQASPELKAAGFDKVLHELGHRRWRRAATMLEELAKSHAQEPILWYNLALIYGCLGKREKTAEAWHQLAAIPAADLDDRVEAEARHQMITAPDRDQLPVMKITWPVADASRLSELLLSDRQVGKIPIDPSHFAVQDEPPPKGVYWLYDRPAPSSGSDVQLKDIPRIVGEMMLFGKQTDREARLELALTKGPRYDESLALVRRIAGDAVGEPSEQPEGETVSSLSEVLGWRWRFPDDTPPALRRELTSQMRQQVVQEAWAECPQSIFDGKTPQQVAGDAQYQVPLLANILLLQLDGEQHGWDVDYDQLRQKLGLPIPEPLDPETTDVSSLPIVRYSRLNIEKLSDKQLLSVFSRATATRTGILVEQLGNELIKRGNLPEKMQPDEIYGVIAQTAADDERAVQYLLKAQESSQAAGRSPARWMIFELRLRLGMAEPERARQLLNTISQLHGREPGVMEALQQVLIESGILRPDGTMAQAPPQPEQPAANQALWTPGSSNEPAPPKSEGGGSGLWIPE